MFYEEINMQIVRKRRLLINAFDAWLFDEIKPYLGQRIVEIGCGMGNLLQHLAKRELVVGLDTCTECILHLEDIYQEYPNLEFHVVNITEPQVLKFSRKHFDTAISLNVFEHVKDDITALKHTANLLCNDGILAVVVPAMQVLSGSMDSSIGHYRRYTKTTLRTKIEQAGLEIVHQKYINMLGALGWWFNGKILKRKIPPIGQLKLFNTIVPILRRVEGIFTAPFGISLLTVARKRNQKEKGA